MVLRKARCVDGQGQETRGDLRLEIDEGQSEKLDIRQHENLGNWRRFIGSHLVDKLVENEKNEVIVVDNYFTGSKDNLKKWTGHPRFELIGHDVTEPLLVEVDQIPSYLPCFSNLQQVQSCKDIRIARILNTYGPRMNIDDGRVVRNFIAQVVRSNLLVFDSNSDAEP
ncbi:hypothetical protein L484_005128 [Morus notabilis]|uniref:Uncharacterized protein n=1 Tax=Morus notabilis TaxID=981085 RepID=W9R6C7_9ROSA|nr:hypothetical protein L484_005128 [Morus notabilis]